MISTRASKESALAISTICWSAIDRPRTGLVGRRAWTPRRSSSPWTCSCIARRSIRRSAPQRVAAHHHVLRDGQVGEQRSAPGRSPRCRRRARRAGPWKSTGSPSTSSSPASGRDDAGQQPDEGGLAGAVLADQRADLAGAQRDVAVAQRAHRAVGLRCVAQRDDRGRRRRSSRLPRRRCGRRRRRRAARSAASGFAA